MKIDWAGVGFILVLVGLMVAFLLGGFTLRSWFDNDLFQEMVAKQRARDAYSCVVNAQKQYLEVTGGLK